MLTQFQSPKGSATAGRELGHVFLSTFEKQLDSKRRIVVPHEFRAAVGQPFEGVFCFPCIEADCLEGGGKALFDRYAGLIEELPFGDPLRSALEATVYGGMARLSFDEAGRITLPPALCDMFGIAAGDWISVVGMGDRFQIWPREAFQAHRAAAREEARTGVAALRTAQRARMAGVPA